MPQILSLLKYSFTNRRSTLLIVYSVLATFWAAGWLLLWTITFIYAGLGEGGAVDVLARMCAWSVLVVAFCALPVAIQLAWAMKVKKEEAVAMPAPWQYGPAPIFRAPPVPPAYQPAYIGGDHQVTDRLLEEEKRRTRELEYENARLVEERRRSRQLEYENARLKQRLREQETRPLPVDTDERLLEAQNLERMRRYGEAGRIYEEIGRWEDATRVRMLEIKGGNL